MPGLNLHTLTSSITRVAADAGRLLEGYFNRLDDVVIQSKSSSADMVSEADTKAEDLIRERLAVLLPAAGFIGEESHDPNAPRQELNWVVDPLDGTSNFLSGLQIWAVSIALTDANLEPLVGVVHSPELRNTWSAARGMGTTCNGVGVTVRRQPPGGTLLNAMLATGFPYDIKGADGQKNIHNFVRMQTHFHKIRRLGSAAVDLALVADGTFDGMWELKLRSWDSAAGVLLVTEAGGICEQISGEHYSPGDDDLLVASRRDLLELMRSILRPTE